MDNRKNFRDEIADLAQEAPDAATALVRDALVNLVLRLKADGMPDAIISRASMEVGVRISLDVWGPAATAQSLRETAEKAERLPDMREFSSRH